MVWTILNHFFCLYKICYNFFSECANLEVYKWELFLCSVTNECFGRIFFIVMHACTISHYEMWERPSKKWMRVRLRSHSTFLRKEVSRHVLPFAFKSKLNWNLSCTFLLIWYLPIYWTFPPLPVIFLFFMLLFCVTFPRVFLCISRESNS